MTDTEKQVEELKAKGNEAMKGNDVDGAIEYYTQAIKLSPTNHVLFSNRSAAYCKGQKYLSALEDADQVIELKSDWAKGYSRKGAALAYMARYGEAKLAYSEGEKLDPGNDQIKSGIAECDRHLTGPANSQPISNPFNDPLLWAKLEADERTKEYLKDQSFKTVIESLQRNPRDLGKHMQDSRVMTCLGVLLGMPQDIMSPSNGESHMEVDPQPDNKTAQEEPQDTEDMAMGDGPARTSPENAAKALAEKELGNASYKKKEFETAISHYNKAVELDPINITFRNNRAAVYFEQGKFEECIKECEDAIEIGRENRADYKLVAKALARAGNAYAKLDKLDEALKFYNKSLSEHRDPSIVTKTKEIEKKVKEQQRLEYINPEISLEEKKKGNDNFAKGDYPSAIKHYGEAIKRNPEDPKLYSNRAACYTKLAEFDLALRDCDKCIALDPTFVKGFLRKGANLLAMKEHSKAADAYQKALDLDSNCKEALDGYKKAAMGESGDPEAVKKRAMQDPEVQQILGDPAMQLILQQMQKDPKALQEHLQNPEVATKIQKLMESGLIAFR